MDLCVTVLTGLGGGHLDDLARTAYQGGVEGVFPRRGDCGKVLLIGFQLDEIKDAPLMTTCPFLRRAEHCMGNVKDAPEPAWRTEGESTVRIAGP